MTAPVPAIAVVRIMLYSLPCIWRETPDNESVTTPLSEIQSQSSSPSRSGAIDAFRALTMLLMIFVNDLWTLEGVPSWLEHASAAEDKLGFADIIFPAFLFIAGVSIPYAISSRLNRGESKTAVCSHIALRSFALIVMGVFHVNLEAYNHAAILPRPYWELLITFAFFLIWLDYPAAVRLEKKRMMQWSGIILLLLLALIYQGGTPGHDEWMRFRWWGILGLIGWAYLITSLLYLVVRNNMLIHLLLIAVFVFLNAAARMGWLETKPFLAPIAEGMPVLTMIGVVVSLLYQQFGRPIYIRFWAALGLLTIGLFIFGFLTRPIWGIHKINASPSWITICAGLNIIVFGCLVWLIDIQKRGKWFATIKPGGSSTLTCYLLPYIHYPLYSIAGVTLPLLMRTGLMGIVKSLLYALIIILIAGLLEKRGIKIRI